MAAEHVLALDAGTSGARALVARPGRGIVAAAREEWGYHCPPGLGPLARTFDPDEWWAAICAVARRALKDAGLSGTDLAAVAVTSQRLGVVVIDADGRSLLASPNVDARAFAEGLAIDAKHAERVYRSTGKLPSLLLAPARLHWLRKNDEAAYERAAALLTVADWIAYKLTGEARSEHSLAADCGLLDVASRERDSGLLADLDVPSHLLPPLVSAGDAAGAVTNEAAHAGGLAAGTPVVIAGGDTQCALLGMGITGPGEAGVAAGWSCPIEIVTGTPRFDEARRTWTNLHVVPGRWLVESSATDAGRVWRWWSETLLGPGASLEEAAALAATAPPASDLLALLGPVPMNAGAMNVHLGGVLMTTPLHVAAYGRGDLLRAALENIAYAVRANLEQAEEVSGTRATRIAAGGGLTRTKPFSRIVADVLNRPIEVAREVDVTGLGAAAIAARAVGLRGDGLVAATDRIDPDGAVSQTYDRQYQRWRQLGPALDAVREQLP
jgi:autoinducer 2 (AI-2) kinase